MIIEINDCWQCPIIKENNSTFCPFMKDKLGFNINVQFIGANPELHKDCPMKKYEHRSTIAQQPLSGSAETSSPKCPADTSSPKCPADTSDNGKRCRKS